MNKRPELALLLYACLAGVFVLSACTRSAPAGFNGTDISMVPWGGDFSLINQDGVRSGPPQYRGRVLALFFGFTHCPDICSPTLARLAELRKQLGGDARDVQVLFITLDPAHDTPAQLKSFLSQFDSQFVGLTGSTQEIDSVIGDYKVSFERHQEKGVSRISHNGGIFLFDRRGKLRVFLREGMSLPLMKQDVQTLLAEPS